MKKEMLINVLQPEECRIAIVEDGVLEELYVERTSHESYTGNIYKGKIVNLEPAIQAAFVDFSVGRNGFLHVSDVEPQYYRRHLGDDAELAPRDRSREPRPARDEPRPARDEPRSPRDEPRSLREEDRYRERDRPDRSEKGRRDRTERRFGEGLVEDWEPPAYAARTAPAPPPPPPVREEPPKPEARKPEPEPEPASFWPPRRAESERPAEPIVADEPRGRSSRSAPPAADSSEADLPPSRTHRSRSTRPAPVEEPAEPVRARTPSPRPVEPEREPEPEAPSRRGWGRGRSRPERPEVEAPAARIEPEPEPEPFEPEIVPEDEGEIPRSRRGGRSAIRSRGGDREPARPREREREPEPRFRDIEEPEPVAPEPEVVRPRAAEPEPRTRGGRGRTAAARSADTEAPRERLTPHDRAGEPGYVPRRERSRPAEPAFDPDASWREPLAEADDDLDRAGDFDPDTEPTGEETARGEGPKRRRRRRGRRRDRTEREVEAKTTPDADLDRDIDEDEDEDDDFEPAPVPTRAKPAPAARRPAAPAPKYVPEPSDDLGNDDFDFGDDDRDDDDDEDEDDEPRSRVAAGEIDPDDEIDPELEDEIRREIEEIQELEREMGLRGTTEARPRRGEPAPAAGGRGAPRGRGLTKPPLQEIFRRGDEVLVQVIKESIGTKGPTLSTYISIPGRYLVLMPGLNRVGVSRKIADEGQRRRLREIMNALDPPKGLGFIVRTAGLDRTKKELARDLAYLLRLWKVILKRIKKAKSPAPIYQESDMITRTIRDIFNAEIDTIWIDEPQAFERAQEFLRVVMPKFVGRLKLYEDKVPLFHKYGLEEEIAKIQRRRVDLPEGGSIVIDPTEALVAIDVNSGNFRVENDAERTAYEMNLRAAKEIARQLRLRDLGGVICNDFIDMRDEKYRRGVEKALRDAIKRDRARTKILRMSQFGIIEMTRQRIRPSLKRSVYEDCTHCAGAGVAKTAESMAIDVTRLLALAANRSEIVRVNIVVSPAVETYLNNRKRREIARIEADSDLLIHIRSEENAPAEHLHIECFDAQNSEIRILPAPAPAPRRGR